MELLFVSANPAYSKVEFASRVFWPFVGENSFFILMVTIGLFFAVFSFGIYQRSKKKRKVFFGGSSINAKSYFEKFEGDYYNTFYAVFILLSLLVPVFVGYFVSAIEADPEGATRFSHAAAWGCVAGAFNIAFVLGYLLWQSQKGNLTLRMYPKAALILVGVVLVKGFLDYFGLDSEIKSNGTGFWNSRNLIFSFTAAIAPYPLFLSRLLNSANSATRIIASQNDNEYGQSTLREAFGEVGSERCFHHRIYTPKEALSFSSYQALHMVITGANETGVHTTAKSLDVLILKEWLKEEYHNMDKKGITRASQLFSILNHLGFIQENNSISAPIHNLYEEQLRLELELESLMEKWGAEMRAPYLSFEADGTTKNVHSIQVSARDHGPVKSRLLEVLKNLSEMKSNIRENIKSRSKYPVEQYEFVLSVFSGKGSIRNSVISEYDNGVSDYLESLKDLKKLFEDDCEDNKNGAAETPTRPLELVANGNEESDRGEE